MRKIAAIAYHKNASSIYNPAWIEQCVQSMKDQTDTEFDVIELDYGGGGTQYFWGEFDSYPLPTFVDAMNMLFDYCFVEGYDAVLNINIDDYYDRHRVELQRAALTRFDVVGSNFYVVDQHGRTLRTTEFDGLDVSIELANEHNIIAHGVVGLSRRFWTAGARYDPQEIPMEDMKLWQRWSNKMSFVVLPQHLFYYRVHPNSVCNNARSR